MRRSGDWCLGILAIICHLSFVNADFHLFTLGSPVIPAEVPVRCRAAIVANIACDALLQSRVQRFSPNITTKGLDRICTPACGASIQSYALNVRNQCGETLAPKSPDTPQHQSVSTPFVDYADINWWRYNVTCLRSTTADSSYCQLDGTACGDCHLRTLQMMWNSRFGQSAMALGSSAAFDAIKSKCSLPTSLYQITFTTPSSPTTAPAAPAPCEYGSYTAKGNDSCVSISQSQQVGTQALISLNGLDAGCNSLHDGLKLCLPQTCATYTVSANDTCQTIMKASFNTSGIFTQSQLLAWNKYIDTRCSNLGSIVGENICVSPPGSTKAPQWSNNAESPEVPKPSNANPGSIQKCAEWYTVKFGDNCLKLIDIAETPLNDLVFLNGGLRSDCTNLVPDRAYCVKPVGLIRLYPDWSPIVMPTDILTKTINFNLPANNITKSYIWPNATSPPPTMTMTIPPLSEITRFANYTGCPDFAANNSDFADGIPWYAEENDAWMDMYSSYCLFSSGQPIPTGTATFPPLQIPLTPIPAPTSTSTGAVDDCLKWVVCAGKFSTCQAILDFGNITLAEFVTMNPAVGNDCQTLWPNTAYCVDDILRHPDPDDEAPITTHHTHNHTTTGSSTTFSSLPQMTSILNSATTMAPPAPTAGGTSGRCTKWHVYVTGESCPRILVSNGIKLPAFKALNPSVDETCSNLTLGNAYCVASL